MEGTCVESDRDSNADIGNNDEIDTESDGDKEKESMQIDTVKSLNKYTDNIEGTCTESDRDSNADIGNNDEIDTKSDGDKVEESMQKETVNYMDNMVEPCKESDKAINVDLGNNDEINTKLDGEKVEKSMQIDTVKSLDKYTDNVEGTCAESDRDSNADIGNNDEIDTESDGDKVEESIQIDTVKSLNKYTDNIEGTCTKSDRDSNADIGNNDEIDTESNGDKVEESIQIDTVKSLNKYMDNIEGTCTESDRDSNADIGNNDEIDTESDGDKVEVLMQKETVNYTDNMQEPCNESDRDTNVHLENNDKIDIESYDDKVEESMQKETVNYTDNMEEPCKKADMDITVDVNNDEIDTESGDGEVKELLNEEEVALRKDNIIEIINMQIDIVNSLEKHTDGEGKYVPEIKKIVEFINGAYWGLAFTCFVEKDNELLHKVDLRNKVRSILISTQMFDLLSDLVINNAKKISLSEGWMQDASSYLVWQSVNALACYSDDSDDFAEAITNEAGLLESIKEILEEAADAHLENSLTDNTDNDIASLCLLVLLNCSLRESNVPRLRHLKIMSCLQRYMESPRVDFGLNALTCLAAIVNENECNIINSQPAIVKHLLTCLKFGMKNILRRFEGRPCKECGQTVRLLARNDANKKLLVELGALELLVELVKTGDVHEQYEGVNAIGYLLFDEDTRKHVVDSETLGLCDVLIELKGSDDRRIGQLADNALWTLREECSQSNVAKYRQIGESYKSDAGTRQDDVSTSSTQGHVMLSYQWDDQSTIKRIRDRLMKAGLNVWMDIDALRGSTLQAMAGAVENASVVLISMSQKYKESHNCRAEAEYAFTKRKGIIPLMMQNKYKPDGWLGIIQGAKLYYDFSDQGQFDGKIDELMKGIETLLSEMGWTTQREVVIEKEKSKPLDSVDGPTTNEDVAITKQSVALSTPSVPWATVLAVRKWKQTDVAAWVAKNELQSCDLARQSGAEIAVLMVMRLQSPDCFYRCLRDTLNVRDLPLLSKIFWALYDLAESPPVSS